MRKLYVNYHFQEWSSVVSKTFLTGVQFQMRKWEGESIRWTEEAAIWLEDIYKYIAKDNPEAARRVMEKIFRKVQILYEFPEIGYHHSKEPEGEIRVLLYGHYRIAYLYRNPDMAEILGIFHGALGMRRYI